MAKTNQAKRTQRAKPASSRKSSRPRTKQSPRGVDAVRRAVERTVHTTVGSAGLTRDRAQEVVDEVVSRAEQTAARAGRGVREAGQRQAEARAGVSDRVSKAVHDLRTLTTDEMKDLRSTIERLANRVESLESKVSAATGLRRPGSAAATRKATASRKATAKKATAKRATKKKATKKKATAKKAPAKRATAKRAAAKKRSGATRKRAAKTAAKRSATKGRTRPRTTRTARSRSS